MCVSLDQVVRAYNWLAIGLHALCLMCRTSVLVTIHAAITRINSIDSAEQSFGVSSSEYIHARDHYTLRSLVSLCLALLAVIYPCLLKVRYFSWLVENIRGQRPRIYCSLAGRGGTSRNTLVGYAYWALRIAASGALALGRNRGEHTGLTLPPSGYGHNVRLAASRVSTGSVPRQGFPRKIGFCLIVADSIAGFLLSMAVALIEVALLAGGTVVAEWLKPGSAEALSTAFRGLSLSNNNEQTHSEQHTEDPSALAIEEPSANQEHDVESGTVSTCINAVDYELATVTASTATASQTATLGKQARRNTL